MEHSLDITSSVIIPYFNFFLFVAAFYFMFRKPLAKMASDRRQKYLESSKAAAAALESAQKQFSEIKSKFDSLDAELRDFKNQSEALAKEEARRLEADGEKLAQQIAAETKRIALDEVARAKAELRQEIVAAALKAAEEKIEKNLSQSDKSKILSQRVNDLRTYHV